MNGYIAFYRGKELEVHADTSYAAQLEAAESFKNKMGWTGELVGGCLHDGIYAFVFKGDRWDS